MEALVKKLLARRSRIRELIDGFRVSERTPFPNWGKSGEQNLRGGWEDTLNGGTMRMN
jgi:hypothetical protein